MSYSQMGTMPWGGGAGGAENAERGCIYRGLLLGLLRGLLGV